MVSYILVVPVDIACNAVALLAAAGLNTSAGLMLEGFDNLLINYLGEGWYLHSRVKKEMN